MIQNVTNGMSQTRVTKGGLQIHLTLTSLLEIPFSVVGGQDLEYYLNGIQILLCFW